MSFYAQTLRKLQDGNQLELSDEILVVCGGPYDAATLSAAGMQCVTISGIGLQQRVTAEPYTWVDQDAERLTYPDASFDWAIVHAGLHHCHSPHRALLEMCRVARKGVLVFEARDSLLMRVAGRLRLVPDFEIVAVVLEGGDSGGVANSAVPNYIYRWTEREVRQTIESAFPERENRISFFYGLRLPEERIALMGGPMRLLMRLLGYGASALQALAPKQGNQFAFAIRRDGGFKPWLNGDGTRLRAGYKLGS